MGREYKILSALEGNYDKAPKPILFCEDLSVLEAPFYLMERVQELFYVLQPRKLLCPVQRSSIPFY